MTTQYSPPPKRPFKSWMDFILTDGSIPAVLESKNGGSGMNTGNRYIAWDFDGRFFATFGPAGRAVWLHRKNFEVLSTGTLDLKGKYPDVPCIVDYQDLADRGKDVVILMFNGDTSEAIVHAEIDDPRYNSKMLSQLTRQGAAILFSDLDDAKMALAEFADAFPEQLSAMNPHLVTTRIRMANEFSERDIHTLSSAIDMIKLLSSFEKTRHITDIQQRVSQVMGILKESKPSAMLMKNEGVFLKPVLYDTLKTKRTPDSFGKLLLKAHTTIFTVELTGDNGISHNTPRSTPPQILLERPDKQQEPSIQLDSPTRHRRF